MRVPTGVLLWQDRRLGAQAQDVANEVGDFVLKRADGYWAYQLAVVVDDVAQGVTHIVRGEDLADNTPRQILLLQSLGYRTPSYLHTPLVLGPNGEKLSKQNGAQALDLGSSAAVRATLKTAAAVLGLSAGTSEQTGDPAGALAAWVAEWQARWAGR
jgi:glutamyl-Q tRNA(Asp) synthetase